MALLGWLIQPMPCSLLAASTPTASDKEVLGGNFLYEHVTVKTAARALGGPVMLHRVVLGANQVNEGPPLVQSNVAPA